MGKPKQAEGFKTSWNTAGKEVNTPRLSMNFSTMNPKPKDLSWSEIIWKPGFKLTGKMIQEMPNREGFT